MSNITIIYLVLKAKEIEWARCQLVPLFKYTAPIMSIL
jgi:hypothetical protein